MARIPEAVTLRIANFAQLDPLTLYALLRLRVDVFVVEQQCPYPELDGRDVEPATQHFWLELEQDPIAYLRLLADPDGTMRLGRVVVAPAQRSAGLAGKLMTAALTHIGSRECVLNAQSYLVNFYARHGFRPCGPEFIDDGIPHVPMRRPGA